VGDASAVHLQFITSRFTNNTNLVDVVYGAALQLNGGIGLVKSCTFAGNHAVKGGAIGLRNHPRLTVMSSFFRDNEGRHEGLDHSLQMGSLVGRGCFWHVQLMLFSVVVSLPPATQKYCVPGSLTWSHLHVISIHAAQAHLFSLSRVWWARQRARVHFGYQSNAQVSFTCNTPLWLCSIPSRQSLH
jgi:hypothetical protein